MRRGAGALAESQAPVVPLRSIASPLLAWHRQHGRHNLPWQQDATPYRVWISEVMLQQTQVQTVIPYYERFIERFPDLATLAVAPLDAVLHLWAGLGYYSRARNLHRAAQQAVVDHGGELPSNFESLHALPGIGRSTAAAILALSSGARHAILDGNVKRVLSRVFLIDGAPGNSAVNAQLWHLAERETPLRDVARYTQAIMDLGATVCTRARVSCAVCPLRDQCGAFGDGRVAELPRRRSRAARRVRTVFMLVAQRNDGCVLLERRAHQGIWGGLWSLPEFVDRDTLKSYCAQKLLKARATAKAGPPIEHAFTHFDLIIMPLRVPCAGAAGVMDTTHQLWYNPARPEPVGLPAPVQRLLAALVDRLAD